MEEVRAEPGLEGRGASFYISFLPRCSQCRVLLLYPSRGIFTHKVASFTHSWASWLSRVMYPRDLSMLARKELLHSFHCSLHSIV